MMIDVIDQNKMKRTMIKTTLLELK